MDTNTFFGLLIDPDSLSGKAYVLLLAVLLGGLIGLERQLKGNAAGLRTHILVCVGATLITLTSVELGGGHRRGGTDTAGRIVAQIVSGIGFLGAGAILRDGTTIHGLTTAASIWVTAAIGITIGVSPHSGEIGVVATGVVLFTLIVLRRIEPKMSLASPYQTMEIAVSAEGGNVARVLEYLEGKGITVVGVQTEQGAMPVSNGGSVATRQLRLQVKLPEKFDQTAFTAALIEEKGALSCRLD